MSSTVSAPFKLELLRLRWQFALALGAMAAIAVVPWLLLELSVLTRWAYSASGLLVIAAGLYRAGWLQWQTHVRLLCDSIGEWQLIDENGRVISTSLHADSRCFRHFVWLRWVASRSVLIGPGDLNPEAFRQLKVVLRRAPAVALRERVA